MSDAAKERVIALGTQFNSIEHEVVGFEDPSNRVPTLESGSPKKSFWKRNTSKLPGSIKPAHGGEDLLSSTSVSLPSGPASAQGKAKSKLLSFQEFNNETSDAWGEDDDDVIRVDPAGKKILAPLTRVRTVSGSEVRESILMNAAPELKKLPEQLLKKEEHKTSRPSPLSLLTWHRNQSSLSSSSKPSTQSSTLPPVQSPRPPSPIRAVKLEFQDQEIHKLEKFGKLLAGPNTDLDAVRKLSWSGIPVTVRPTTWQLLCGYLPANIDRRQATLDRKREEYHNFVMRYYSTRYEDTYSDTFRQIHIDIPRTNPLIPLFQQPLVQEIFERILYIWAIRHPASGYVQGINDLVTPFFVVFLSAYVDGGLEDHDVSKLSKEILDTIEADSFWCMSKLLDGIQDNYTFAQPGIQMKVNALRELIQRIDEPLNNHLEKNSVEYLQFAFRWMNNLLMREMPLRSTIRLWDTYLAVENGFASFHLYVCAAFLKHFSSEIKKENDFQGLMLLLQNLPTQNWDDQQISLLLAEAYRLEYMFKDAPKHLQHVS
ncbi:TBC1 domain family member 22B-like isoform X2 [Acropora palmata]|uniref:TBC1 domain family member 22B-like isoform X2 n=1 Tax=Acropora palmata TaxID=6131 RepID=UPI003DA05579